MMEKNMVQLTKTMFGQKWSLFSLLPDVKNSKIAITRLLDITQRGH